MRQSTLPLDSAEYPGIRIDTMLRAKRFRMTVRCDACFEAGRGDGMRGAITHNNILLECRCRFIQFDGATL